MKKTLAVLFFTVVLAVPCIACMEGSETDNPSTLRETVRCQLEHIAGYMDRMKRQTMTNSYGSAVGNILKGSSGWGCYSSLHGAVNRAFRECEVYGGGCEELFTLCIFNDTPREVNIYLYHPWETDFSKENALWSWNFIPRHESNLAVDQYRLYIPQRMYLKVDSPDGSRTWNPRRIDGYNLKQRSFRDGQNLRIRLILGK